MTQPIRVTHIITDLDTGGAEVMLLKLLASMDSQRFTNRVISLSGDGVIGEKIRKLGIQTDFVNMRRGAPDLPAFLRLVRLLRQNPPDIVQTWMYHSDLVGGLAAKAAGNIPVLWNIRNLNLDPAVTRRSTLWVVRLCALLSGWLPENILTNAWTAMDVHVDHGYNAGKFRVVSNGFDTGTFHPDAEAKRSVREELGLYPHELLVGMAARFDPLKDHHTFILAAEKVRQMLPNAVFMLCGKDVDANNHQLMAWIEKAGLRSAVHLLGPRYDMPRLMAGLDVFVLSSVGEAFPNVIGEAMACGVPCVVTDVGDSAQIVGNTGLVVPPSQPGALAEAICDLLFRKPEERATLGELAHRRVLRHFSLPVITSQYESIYQQAKKG